MNSSMQLFPNRIEANFNKIDANSKDLRDSYSKYSYAMPLLEKAVKDIFCPAPDQWRDDGHIPVSRITSQFQDSFKEFCRTGSGEAAVKSSALVKLHWNLCALTDQASAERLEDATRLLDILQRQGTSQNLFELTGPEADALKKVTSDINQNLMENPPLADFGPLVGSLAQVSQRGSRPRKAGVLGLSKLKETSERELMDRFLAAHRLYSSRFQSAVATSDYRPAVA